MKLAEARLRRELEELSDLSARSGGKFRFDERADGVRLFLHVRSPVLPDGDGEPLIQEWEHTIDVVLPDTWPAGRMLVVHRSPVGALHPNIAYPTTDSVESQLLARLGLFGRGAVCYTSRPSPQLRLRDLVRQLYDMIGLRNERYTLDDALSTTAVRWLNRVLAEDPGLVPTERRPLVAPAAAEAGHP